MSMTCQIYRCTFNHSCVRWLKLSSRDIMVFGQYRSIVQHRPLFTLFFTQNPMLEMLLYFWYSCLNMKIHGWRLSLWNSGKMFLCIFLNLLAKDIESLYSYITTDVFTYKVGLISGLVSEKIFSVSFLVYNQHAFLFINYQAKHQSQMYRYVNGR